MTTAPKDIYSRFFDRIEEDEEFFNNYDLDEVQQEALICERAKGFLRETCSYLRRHCDLDFSLGTVVDEATGEEVFGEPLTDDEADLLAMGMTWRYYERKIALLTPKINALSASEMKYAHSPNQERTTYLALAKQIKDEFDIEITHYAGRDRNTGTRKTIAYSLPEEDDED